MTGFLGRYEYQLDPKGRVSLPADFRRQADGSRFVLLRWKPDHLTLFPLETWSGMQARILEQRRAQPQAAHHLRRITSQAVNVEPDRQGRILVPLWLKDAVGLEGTVLVTGNVDRIEIWDPVTFDTATAEADDPGQEVEGLTHEIFG